MKPANKEQFLAATSNGKSAIRSRSRDFLVFGAYFSILLTLCLISFMIAATHMKVRPLNFQAPIAGTQAAFSPTVSLITEVISVDPISRTITMNWYPELATLNCTSPTSSFIDIYVPVILLDVASPSWSSSPDDQLAFRLRDSDLCSQFFPYPSFRTVTKLISAKSQLNLQSILHQSTLQDYPLDVYFAPFTFYTRSSDAPGAVPLEVSGSFGNAVNFQLSLFNAFILGNRTHNSLQFTLKIERSMATKLFVIMVAITNWLITTAFLTITAAAFVYKSHGIYSEIFVVPVGALFAFTSIRANLPGAPAGSGATLDLFAILPVLIIMSLCSFALLLIILCRRILEETRPPRIHVEEIMDNAPLQQMKTNPLPDGGSFQTASPLGECDQTSEITEAPNCSKVDASAHTTPKSTNRQLEASSSAKLLGCFV